MSTIAQNRHLLTDAERARGGRNRSHVNRMLANLPEEFRTLYGELLNVITSVRDGKMEPTHGNAISQAARSAVEVLEVGEIVIMDERLQALEVHSDNQQ